MKIERLIQILVICTSVVLCGCMETDVYKGPQEEEEKSYNDFDYSTVNTSTSLQVSYLNMGIQAAVYFEVYDENPVVQGEYGYTKRTDVVPLYAAYTDKTGVFSGVVSLPSYLSQGSVYIYTPAFYAQTLIEAQASNGVIQASDDAMAETRLVSATNKDYDSYMVTDFWSTPDAYRDTRWKTWLGDYNKQRNGEVEYEYEGGELSVEDNANLYEAHAQVINVNKDCPAEYRRSEDLYISKDAEIAVTFLGQNTCWNCSLGYYYYKEGEEPTSLDDMDIIMLFPNTQDGQWTNDPSKAQPTAGIERGTAVQLMFYPDGNKSSGQKEFPAGYRIGFVLANNAWSNRIEGFRGNNQYRAATSSGLSVRNNGSKWNEARTAVYEYNGYKMISFEDYESDHNFSDIVITTKTNPVDAITDVPVVEDEYTTTTVTLRGMYAFEDLWPSKGDFDLNDVMVRADYQKTIGLNDNHDKIYKESFIFQTFQNVASNLNGVAFRVDGADQDNVKSRTFEISTNGTDYEEATSISYEGDNVYILTDNVKSNLGATYRVTVEYNTPINAESEAVPFIFRPSEYDTDKRWEMHIVNDKPTSKMDESYFCQEDDASKPEEGLYYVRGGNYPFGFFLSGANETKLSRMLDPANESKRIDELYPGYSSWVESGGLSNSDWYK